MRPLALALLTLAIAAPTANATVADEYLPIYDASDGVRLTGAHHPRFEFSAGADKAYRRIRGRQAMTMCAGLTSRLDVDFTAPLSSGTLPHRRGDVPVSNFAPPDVCALAVAKPNSNDIDRCTALDTDHPEWCARVTVAVTARGRAYLDRRARSIELVRTSELVRYLSPDWARTPLKPLQDALGGSVVGLPDADASPLAGQVGFYGDAANHTIAVLLADGTRRFLRREGDLITTNVPELVGRAVTVF